MAAAAEPDGAPKAVQLPRRIIHTLRSRLRFAAPLVAPLFCTGVSASGPLVFGGSSSPAAQSAAATEFKCDLARHSTWTEQESLYCCWVRGLGCGHSSTTIRTTAIPSGDYECRSGSAWAWPEEQRSWCCSHWNLGCTQEHPDCLAGITSWRWGWSSDKLAYCCSKGPSEAAKILEAAGACTAVSSSTSHAAVAPAIRLPTRTTTTTTLLPRCLQGFLRWKWGWTPAKRAWCCRFGPALVKSTLSAGGVCKHSTSSSSSATSTSTSTTISTSTITTTGTSSSTTTTSTTSTTSTSTTLTTTTLSITTTQTQTDLYDCSADRAKWEEAWGDAKKKWCCAHRVTCLFTKPPTTTTGTTTTTTPEPTTTTTLEPTTTNEPTTTTTVSTTMTRTRTTERTTSTGTTTSTTTAKITSTAKFDCTAGLKNWELGWADAKRDWCCKQEGVGCLIPLPIENEPQGVETTAAATTTIATTTQGGSGTYDCGAGLLKREKLWSEAKTKWCCKHRVNCEPAPFKSAYDCRDGLEDWEEKWSEEQKKFCCNGRVTCPTGGNKSAASDEDSHVTELAKEPLPFCHGVVHECPHGWAHKELGGYHCIDHGHGGLEAKHRGCRPASHGPFPAADCKKQCKVGQEEMPFCHGDVHECPHGWANNELGGYHCIDHGGCRAAAHGPFPEADCKKQCKVGQDSKADGITTMEVATSRMTSTTTISTAVLSDEETAASTSVLSDGECPDGGLHAHKRCWYLSEKGDACMPTCQMHGLDFSWYVTSLDKPMLPQLLDISPTEQQTPPGLLECFSPGAAEDDAADDAEESLDPGNWSRPSCQLACSCKQVEPKKTEAGKASSEALSSSGFQLHGGMNCFPGRGATAVQGAKRVQGGHNLLSRCQDECAAEPRCEGIVLPHSDTELPLCWLRMNINTQNCAPNKMFDLWLKAGDETTKEVTAADDMAEYAYNAFFTFQPGVNCYPLHGAKPLPESAMPLAGEGDALLNRCAEACLKKSSCEGFVIGPPKLPGASSGSRCWLREGILLKRCQKDSAYSVWLRSGTASASGTTTTIGTSSTVTTSVSTVPATTTASQKFDCNDGVDTMGWTVAKYEWCCEKMHVGCLEETGIVGRASLEHRSGSFGPVGAFAAGAMRIWSLGLASLGLLGLVLLARRRSQWPRGGWSPLQTQRAHTLRARSRPMAHENPPDSPNPHGSRELAVMVENGAE